MEAECEKIMFLAILYMKHGGSRLVTAMNAARHMCQHDEAKELATFFLNYGFNWVDLEGGEYAPY